MTDPRALDEPLTDAELDELEVFLASDAVPQDCMDLEMLDGYLTAVVSGPEMIQPSEWLPQVWSEGSKSAAPVFVEIRDDEWQPLYDAQDARDWIFPIEALAFGDRDDDFTEWVDSEEKRAELIEELPVAAVLIYRFWLSRREATQGRGPGSRRSAFADATRKSRQRLH
jgi:hypothetical protein